MLPTNTWKEALLSLGMPLEATVARILAERDCSVPVEYEFAVVKIDDTRPRIAPRQLCGKPPPSESGLILAYSYNTLDTRQNYRRKL